MKIQIANCIWTIQLLGPRQFVNKLGKSYKDVDGLTDTNTKVMYLRKDKLVIETIRHELFHAYFDSTYTSSASLNADQTEETAAELMGQYCRELADKSDEVFNHFVKLL